MICKKYDATDGWSEGVWVAIGVAERQVRLLDRLDR